MLLAAETVGEASRAAGMGSQDPPPFYFFQIYAPSFFSSFPFSLHLQNHHHCWGGVGVEWHAASAATRFHPSQPSSSHILREALMQHEGQEPPLVFNVSILIRRSFIFSTLHPVLLQRHGILIQRFNFSPFSKDFVYIYITFCS